MKAMTQSPEQLYDTAERGTVAVNRWDVVSLAMGLFTILLALGMSTQPGLIPMVPAGFAIYDWNVLAGVAFYALLYAALSLLAYRMRYGLYAGFHHVAVVAAYLTFGPIGALAVGLIGRALAELGGVVFHEALELRPHTLRQACTSIFFHAGAHGSSTLLAGLLYRTMGGTLPLMTIEPALWLPFIILFVLTVIIHEIFVLARVYWSGNVINLDSVSRGLPSLIFGELF